MTTEIQHENKTSIITRLNESFADLEFVSLESDEEGIRMIISNNSVVGTFELITFLNLETKGDTLMVISSPYEADTSVMIGSTHIEQKGNNEPSEADGKDFERKLVMAVNILTNKFVVAH